MTVHYDLFTTPVGPLLLLADDEGLIGVHFEPAEGGHRIDPAWRRAGEENAGTGATPAVATIVATRAQLTDYFAGARRSFDLPLVPRGTDFQRRVWQLLREIPYGQTISYAELARRVGNPKAMRAVGAANGRNPLPVVVPCHRVIGADGSLTGFGGGIERKRWLLEREGYAPSA